MRLMNLGEMNMKIGQKKIRQRLRWKRKKWLKSLEDGMKKQKERKNRKKLKGKELNEFKGKIENEVFNERRIFEIK